MGGHWVESIGQPSLARQPALLWLAVCPLFWAFLSATSHLVDLPGAMGKSVRDATLRFVSIRARR